MEQKKRSSVAERLKYAREHYAFDIVTEMAKFDEDYCVMQAIIRIPGSVIATGHAIEYRRNNVAYVEVAETIAIGRALAIAGYTLDDEIASTDELTKAFQQDIEDNATTPAMTLDEALQTRTKSGKRYADLDDSNLQYILDKATNEKSKEAARIVLEHRNKI